MFSFFYIGEAHFVTVSLASTLDKKVTKSAGTTVKCTEEIKIKCIIYNGVCVCIYIYPLDSFEIWARKPVSSKLLKWFEVKNNYDTDTRRRVKQIQNCSIVFDVSLMNESATVKRNDGIEQ